MKRKGRQLGLFIGDVVLLPIEEFCCKETPYA